MTSLPKGLRSLDVSCHDEIKFSDLLRISNTFPLLTKLRLKSNNYKFSDQNLKEKIYLPNLIDLIIQQNILEKATFVLPQLRKLNIFYAPSSSLDYLKEFKKLKIILLDYATNKFTEKIINSNFLSSFPSLNRFLCMDNSYHYVKFTFDFDSDDIFKSLIYLNVHDSDKVDYYEFKNENAKRLQEKRIPFLCKYGGGSMEWQHKHDDD